MKLADALKNPANYQYLVTPLPIARTDRLTRVQKDVWSVIYTRERMNVDDDVAALVHLSQRQIARTVGLDRKGVKAALFELAERGVLRIRGRTAGNPRQRGRTFLETLWPDWLEEPADLLGSVRARIEYDEDEDEDDDEGGEGVPYPRGRGCHTPGEGGAAPPIDQLDQVEDQDLRGAPPHDPPAGSREGSGPSGEEVEESDLDGGSRGVDAELEVDREARAAAREARAGKKPRRKVLANGDEALLREPSRRPEMGRWREKNPDGRDWKARDLVGYFVCRYREELGEEPAEFFATTDAIFRHHGANVAQYVKRWLGGDYRRAREIVERILARAADRGMPVKLGYFFTPAREAAVRRLDEEVPRGRSPTPAERNDARGDFEANREYWEGKKAEFERRDAERRAKENGLANDPGRDDGEVHPPDRGAE